MVPIHAGFSRVPLARFQSCWQAPSRPDCLRARSISDAYQAAAWRILPPMNRAGELGGLLPRQAGDPLILARPRQASAPATPAGPRPAWKWCAILPAASPSRGCPGSGSPVANRRPPPPDRQTDLAGGRPEIHQRGWQGTPYSSFCCATWAAADAPPAMGCWKESTCCSVR